MIISNKELIDSYIELHADSMKKQFENISSIEDQKTYKQASEYLNVLINDATSLGMLCEPEVSNEYTMEIGRMARMCGLYENKYVEFKNIRVKSPLVIAIEEEMHKRNLKQRQAARMLGINESVLSQILSGKRPISMKIAKHLFSDFGIDASLIIMYA